MPDFTPLPPPPGGHGDALARGRRRRARRMVATAGALLSVVAVVALSLPLGGSSAVDRLVPQPAASATGGPAAAEPTAGASPRRDGARVSATSPAGMTPASTSPVSAAPSSTAAPTGPSAPAFDRVVRSYAPPADAVTLCSLNASVGGSQREASLGWCHNVAASEIVGGYRLSVVVCRSSDNTRADLHPELVPVRMRVALDDTDIWSLAVRPTLRETLPTEPGGCWRWSTDWDARGADGRPVVAADYDLLGAAMADELPETGDHRATFTVRES